MTVHVSKLFTEDDRKRIEAAVQAAERTTSGEIVPYVVEQSDHYEDAEWRAGFLLGFLAFVAFTIVRSFTTAWVPLDLLEVAMVTLLVGAIGLLGVRILPSVKRRFAGQRLIDRRTEQRAAEAFIAAEVFNTRERTGILIFVSLLERTVLVIGDSGINAKVKRDDWHEVVHCVVKGIKTGRPADGLVDAIGVCGRLLQRQGFSRRADDHDELSDRLRVGKE